MAIPKTSSTHEHASHEPAGSGPEEPMDERTKASVEAMKIVNKPREGTPATVPDLLKQHRALFHEKGLDWLWREFDDATGNEASKPEPPPTEPVTKPAQAQPISNP